MYLCAQLKYLWNLDNTTWINQSICTPRLCIAYKSIFEILITQPECTDKRLLLVVYCIQKYLWNPDNTTTPKLNYYFLQLCIAYKSIFEILTTQRAPRRVCRYFCCVLHTKVSLKSWQHSFLTDYSGCVFVVYCTQKYLWNPDNTTEYLLFIGYQRHILKIRTEKTQAIFSSAFLILIVLIILK